MRRYEDSIGIGVGVGEGGLGALVGRGGGVFGLAGDFVIHIM